MLRQQVVNQIKNHSLLYYIKSNLDKVNKATQVEQEFDQAYSKDSTAIDLANVDKDDTTQSQASKLKTQIRDAKANLPSDADSLSSTVQPLEEQG